MSVITDKISDDEVALKTSKERLKKYALKVGRLMCGDVDDQLRECIEKHRNIIQEDEFCIVRIIAKDNIVKNAIRIKYYAWPYLPAPRPNQAVFLYDKKHDNITKRLWVLPDARVMAVLSSTKEAVPEEYKTMQAWANAFFENRFWEYVRKDQKIDMLSEKEYFDTHKKELIKSGCKPIDDTYDKSIEEAFDFGKVIDGNSQNTLKRQELSEEEFRKAISNDSDSFNAKSLDFCEVDIEDVINSGKAIVDQNTFNSTTETQDADRSISSHKINRFFVIFESIKNFFSKFFHF